MPMTRLPALTPDKLLKIIKKLGFMVVRQHGSHIFLKHKDGRTTVVPYHKGKDIGRGLLRAILVDIGMTPKDFEKQL